MISDPRFKALFEDPEFEVDETSREFALMNPSVVAKRMERQVQEVDHRNRKTKTVVEDEEDDDDARLSSDDSDEPDNDDSPDGDDDDSSEDDGKLHCLNNVYLRLTSVLRLC